MKRKILILFLIIIILFITIFFLKRLSKINTFDDFLFIKLFSNSNEKSKTKSVEYEFDVNYGNIDIKSINLVKTIDNKTLVNEKIAPGTNGYFDIILVSNQNLKYKVEFQSLNEKPQNLKFKAFINGKLITEENDLERLSSKLIGNIDKNHQIKITINWYWEYENKENKEDNNIQDTEDAKNIKKYQFRICTTGE